MVKKLWSSRNQMYQKLAVFNYKVDRKGQASFNLKKEMVKNIYNP